MLLTNVGCSSDEGEKADEQSKAADTLAMSPADSLAAIRHPIRDENNPIVTLDTDYGSMTLELYRDVAPVHVDSFLARTKEGFYDNLTIHRVIQHFMIQGGDPRGNGTGNAGYFLPAEFSELPHQKGTLAMARGRDPNSASCQFYIALARNAVTKRLDGSYTIFGHLIKGYDVLESIAVVECVPNPMNPSEVSRPKESVYMRAVYVSDAEGNEVM